MTADPLMATNVYFFSQQIKVQEKLGPGGLFLSKSKNMSADLICFPNTPAALL